MHPWELSSDTTIGLRYYQPQTMAQKFHQHIMLKRNSIIVNDFYAKRLGNYKLRRFNE